MKKLLKFNFLILILFLSGLPVTLSAQNIIWIESAFDSPRLVKSGANGGEIFSKSLPAGSLPQSLALNRVNNSLFWTELSFKNAHINNISADLNLSSVVIDSQSVTRGIVIDPFDKKIYWTSTNLAQGPKIWRSDLDGQNPTVLIDFGSASNSTPRSICLDIAARKMYWTNFAEGKIQRADMSVGATPEDVISGLNGPAGLAFDADSAKIFWTEMNGQQIKSADINGNNITLLIDNLSYPGFISINRLINKMVWSELGTGKIKSAALDGSDIFDYNINAIAPTGIVILPPDGDLVITPADTMVQIHSYTQFNAQLVDTFGFEYPVDANWFVKRYPVGAISNEGLFFAFFPGDAKIKAKYDTMSAKSRLTAIDTTKDSEINKVKIVWRFLEWEFELKTIHEGETFALGGIPHRFNIINTAMVYFPLGSLHEDITLEIKLPEFCKIKQDSVEFVNNIINGIQFNVYAGDSLIEPYYFNKPVSISLPYRPFLIKKLGIDPQDLGLFFASDSVTFDSLGISHVMVDSSKHRIYGLVEHFSSLVVREKENVVVTAVNESINLPAKYLLSQNYPNPFNPKTMINYQLPMTSNVDLSIYNMLGQKVATLVSSKQAAGNYTIEWDASAFASGVYIYILETKEGFKQSKKLLLLK